jgi:hypothetical protein
MLNSRVKNVRELDTALRRADKMMLNLGDEVNADDG